MDAQQFLAEFGHIANAPGGVAQLRALILNFAIQGKLTPQNLNTESSFSLYKKIQSERVKLIASGCCKREKPLPELKSSDLPYGLPSNWSWHRITDVFYSISPSGNKILSSKILDSGKFPVVDQGKRFIAGYTDEEGLIIKIPGPVLVFGDHTTEIKLIEFDFVAGADGVKILRPILLNERYFFWYLKTIKIEDKGYSRHYKILTSYLFPLPPIEEQSRIVAKVDELMALCDKLETQQKARRKLQNNLRQSTLQAVATASSPQELKTTWTRLADHFEQLFNVPEDVDEVREVIYQLAVTGYLVHQDASEGNAINLLNEIDNNRERLIQERRYKRIMKLESEPLAIPAINLPPSWQWSRLLSLGEVNPRNSAEEDASSSFIPMAGVSKRYNEPLNGAITPWHKISKGYTHFANGDVILAKITPCFENGKSAIIKDLPYKIGAGSTEFHVFRPIHKDVLSSYVYIFLKSPLFRIDGEACMTGTAGQKRLPTDYFALRAIPLPPAKEQIRIVAKVEELMTLCNKFESQLRETRKLAEHLCIAVISNFTGVATEQDEEPMKAPQTELIAPLRLGKAPDIKAQSPLATILARHHGEMPAKDLWQRFGGEIDAFYAQLKTEVAHGWIREPAVAEMREKRVESADA